MSDIWVGDGKVLLNLILCTSVAGCMPYAQHPHHRNPAFAGQKSQWTITPGEELQSYTGAVNAGWSCDGSFWGLHLVAAQPDTLGTYRLPAAYPLKIAKFVGDEAENWHGYPVAHWLSPWDKPGESVLFAWKNAGLISKATMSKIHRGKRCDL
jgi:hypothetical protein